MSILIAASPRSDPAVKATATSAVPGGVLAEVDRTTSAVSAPAGIVGSPTVIPRGRPWKSRCAGFEVSPRSTPTGSFVASPAGTDTAAGKVMLGVMTRDVTASASTAGSGAVAFDSGTATTGA